MSYRFNVQAAVKALISRALPNADIVGMDNAADRPVRIGPGGTAIMRDGDPGEPSIDLSPPMYHFDHSIPVELLSTDSPNVSTRERLDAMAAAIGSEVAADPTLGGLCNHLDVTALEVTDLTVLGGASQIGGQFEILASYSISSPLG